MVNNRETRGWQIVCQNRVCSPQRKVPARFLAALATMVPGALVGCLLAGTNLVVGGGPSQASPARSIDVQSAAPLRSWQSIVLHHSATAGGDVATIDAQHRARRDRQGKAWLGIGYHFVVGNGRRMADGQVEPTFRWKQQLAGAHAGDAQQNDRGIGICLIGDFDQAAPTPKQITAARELVRLLAAQFSIPRQRVLRHGDVQATLCPGRMFPWDEVLADLPPPEGG